MGQGQQKPTISIYNLNQTQTPLRHQTNHQPTIKLSNKFNNKLNTTLIRIQYHQKIKDLWDIYDKHYAIVVQVDIWIKMDSIKF